MLMGGGIDIPGGRVSTGPTGGDGGWDEHTGGLPGVRPAPGHGAQDSGPLNPRVHQTLKVFGHRSMFY